MQKKRWLGAVLLIGLLSLAVFGCSGSGDNGGSTEMVTISGRAVDDPLAGADVLVLNLLGTELASGLTDADGYYAVEVYKTDIEDGFEVVVTGGEVNDQPFEGRLRAVYGSPDVAGHANVTLITSLACAPVSDESAGDAVETVSEAVEKMENLGMVRQGEWADTEPGYVDLAALRALVRQMGVEAWLAAMVDDLADGELSAAMMIGFPHAHGGIVSVSMNADQNRFSVPPGDGFEAMLSVNGSAEDWAYKVVEGPQGMAVDAEGRVTCTLPADAAENSTIPFTIWVTNPQNGFGREIRGTIVVLAGGEADNDGDGYTVAQGDCNDADASVYPGAADACGDGIDQNCDGSDGVCDGTEADADGDGFSEAQGDCNDADGSVYPGAEDICGDEVDQDCDGSDAVCPMTWYKDADGDGYSDGATQESVNRPEGYAAEEELTAVSGDCDDENSDVHPGAADICNDGIDQDCSGADAVCYTPPSQPSTSTWYKDMDGDGYSDGSIQQTTSRPGGYYAASELISVSGDCDDTEPTTHPGAEEACGDGVDNNCNASVDEDCATGEARAVLGPLAGATVKVYRLSDLEMPIYSTVTNGEGFFDTIELSESSSKYVLIAISGGEDKDANDDGVTDDIPTPNAGTIYALITAGEFQAGDFQVTALSDILWRYTRNLVGDVADAYLQLRLNDVANVFFKEGTDLNGDAQLDFQDILAFNPLESEHKAALGFEYGTFFEEGDLGKSLMDCYHQGLTEELPLVLDELFGRDLTRFPAADSRKDDIKVNLTPFGNGQVISSIGGINYDSSRDATQNVFYDFYSRNGDSTLALTASPDQGSEILGWEGCDWVSEDKTECECSLERDREVQITFGYTEVRVASNFVDLSNTLVKRDIDELRVYVSHEDSEMAAEMAALVPGSIVAGETGDGFLLRVLDVEKINDYEYVLVTNEDASLEDVILQGTGRLTRKLTHGDLLTDMNNRSRRTRGGTVPSQGLEGVRLVPSDDPNDDVFSIQFGTPPRNRSGDTYSKHWENEVSFSLEDGNSTAEVTISGQMDLEIFVDTAVSFGLTGLEEFKLIPHITNSQTLNVSISGEIKSKGWEKPDIYTIPFGKIAFAIGPVPVWISFDLNISAGGEASISAEVSTGLNMEISAMAGFVYRKGQINGVADFSQSWDFVRPSIENDVTVKAYLKPSLGVLLYGITGPVVSIEGGPKLEAKLLRPEEVENNCRGGVDIASFLYVEGTWEWTFGEGTKIGKLLEIKSIEGEEPLFTKEWPIERWNFPGNQCDLRPAKLEVTGQNILGTVQSGSGILTRQYVLQNSGNFPLDWIIEYSADDALSISQAQGTLEELESTTVTVSVDTNQLQFGDYRRRLKFKNTASSFFWPFRRVADYLSGNAERFIALLVTPPGLSAPTLSEPESLSPAKVQLSWDYADMATQEYVHGYYVFQSTDNDTWEIAPAGIVTDASRQSFVIDNLFPDTTYYFAVAAFDRNSIQSTPSNTVQYSVPAITGAFVPNAPTNVTATGAMNQIMVSWDEDQEAVSHEVYYASEAGVGKDNYLALSGGNKFSEDGNSAIITGLENGVSYYLVVTAVNRYGESAESAETMAAPFMPASAPLVPSPLLAVPGDSQVTLSWPAIEGASFYNIYKAEEPGVFQNNYDTLQGGKKIGGVTPPYVVDQLVNGQTYYFRVTAENFKGESMDSGEVSPTPRLHSFSAPTGVTVVPGNGQVTLTWEPVDGATAYHVYGADFSGVTVGNAIIEELYASSPLVVSGLTNGIEYFFILTAENAMGESDPSTEVSATPTETTVGDTVTDNSGLGMTFVRIPAGTFMMGSPEDEEGAQSTEWPRHQVTLTQDFYIMTTEVTQGQWEAVMGNIPEFNPCGGNCPVALVSWNDIQEFITALNAMDGRTYRLPTEAEWEYAARAETTTPFYNGHIANTSCSDPNLDQIGWYCGNADTTYHPVARKQPNAWGLYDMSGNVWEWVQDWYGSYPDGAVENPDGPDTGPGRVVRGGWWNSRASYCRSASRSWYDPSGRDYDYGFRLALFPGQSPTISAPLGITATAGDGEVTISWQPVSGVTYYKIYVNNAPGASKQNYISVTGGDYSVNFSKTITGLNNDLRYYFVVTAVADGGAGMESSESVEVDAIPTGGSVFMPLEPPTNVQVAKTGKIGSTLVQFQLTWDVVDPQFSYRIYYSNSSDPFINCASPVEVSFTTSYSDVTEMPLNFVVTAVDPYGNESEPSSPNTPMPIDWFL